MPIYDYSCQVCGEETEVIQRHMDPPPMCCGRFTKKKISKTSFALKGEGWYKDHYGLKPRTESPDE